MFKEIVSQISFSPAMVERLSTYARAIKRRQRISKWAIVVLSILLSLQLIVVALPPQPEATDATTTTNTLSDGFISAFVEEEETPASASQSITEQLTAIADELPSTDNATVLAVYVILLLISVITYLSLRQRAKEVRIIRAQLNTGAF